MKKILVFLLFAIAMGSCTEDPDVPAAPEMILKRDLFVQVFTQTQLLETARKQKMIKGDDIDQAITDQYAIIFNQFEVSQEAFETTYKWYYEQPEEMDKIYDEVKVEISKLQDALPKDQ
ncbi:MAG: DUF4296 domain-containing protein [Bacteroidota bacterium]